MSVAVDIPDPYDLRRFLTAQAEVYTKALDELCRGRKKSHWIWYIFPQIRGLGLSVTSRRYAINGLDETKAYLNHPVLGPRLIECTEAVTAHTTLTAEAIFGYPDWLKFRSSMTLFQAVAGEASPFTRALFVFYDGQPDERTLQLLAVLQRREERLQAEDKGMPEFKGSGDWILSDKKIRSRFSYPRTP